MKAHDTTLPGVILIETQSFDDQRGYFRENYQQKKFADLGINGTFVQDNLSRSKQGVLRGLHFQEPATQGKLIQVITGEIFDVAVDVRKGSPFFGQWLGINLSDQVGAMLWIPEGFAHGFVVLSDVANIIYKVTEFWSPEYEQVICWNDPAIGITWPIKNPILADKDTAAPSLADAPTLPEYRPLNLD